MLFDLFLFANLYPYSLIFIQIFCWFLFPYCVFFRRQWVMVHSVIFVSLVVLNLAYCLYLVLWGLSNHLLLVMDVYCLLQWLYTLIINSTFRKHWSIAPLCPIRLLGYHILLNLYYLAWISCNHLMDIPADRLLFICPLNLRVAFQFDGTASLTFQLDWRHHCFLEPLRAVHHNIRSDWWSKLQLRQVVLLNRLVLLTSLLL